MVLTLKQRNKKLTLVGLKIETQNGWQYIMAFREDEAIGIDLRNAVQNDWTMESEELEGHDINIKL